ncbi:hypothetical protein [Actinomycetospora chiangmaiensis]|uniref:hypothetical protein n=1 Tax=Actinomycetospora chiangmaiensis TaxID=402650 RepID=UPI0003A9DB4D|nr:hypothetical protein [Actinomycetospora chiangmaiensis]
MSSATLTQRTTAGHGTTTATRTATTTEGPSTGTTKAGARARATSRRAPAPGTRRPRATSTAATAEAAGGTAPFVLLIMVLLTSGLVATLWLSTAAAADSYRLDDARQATRDRSEEVERLHRDVAAMQAAPALAASAERIGMVPAGTPAVILVHPDGSSQVVGNPQKARAAAPPPPPPAAAPGAPANPAVPANPANPATPANPASPVPAAATPQDARSQGAPDPEALASDPTTGVQSSAGGAPAPAPAGAGATGGR